MQKIYDGKLLMGIVINKFPFGSIPTTDTDASLQLVTLKHPKDTNLAPHLHKNLFHVTGSAETCFVVKKGSIIIDLYSPDKKYLRKISLSEGDIFITANGSGHGISFLTDSEILEIKNGPFREDKVLI